MINKVCFTTAIPKTLSSANIGVLEGKVVAHLDEIPFILRDNGLQWLAKPGVHKNTLAINPIRIEAPAERVWELTKSIERYAEYSDGMVEARMTDGAPLVSGNQIELGLRLNLSSIKDFVFGSQLASSKEFVMVDDTTMALGWHRKVPLTCGAESERWQIVVPRGENACDYYSGLYVPGFTGEISMFGVGEEILKAFESIGMGIKKKSDKPD